MKLLQLLQKGSDAGALVACEDKKQVRGLGDLLRRVNHLAIIVEEFPWSFF